MVNHHEKNETKEFMYVVATKETVRVRDFAKEAFQQLGFDTRWEGEGLDEKLIDNKTVMYSLKSTQNTSDQEKCLTS